MIILGIPPRACGDDLRHDPALVPLVVGLLRDLFGDLLLLLVVEVDSTTVVGPSIRALSVRRCRIMHLVEEFEELAVCDPCRVVVDQQGLVVCHALSALVCPPGNTKIEM